MTLAFLVPGSINQLTGGYLFARRMVEGLRALGHAHRRNPHPVPRLQAIGRIDAAAVDPHLAGAQDPVDMAARNPLADPHQEVVDPLAFALCSDLDRGDVA